MNFCILHSQLFLCIVYIFFQCLWYIFITLKLLNFDDENKQIDFGLQTLFAFLGNLPLFYSIFPVLAFCGTFFRPFKTLYYKNYFMYRIYSSQKCAELYLFSIFTNILNFFGDYDWALWQPGLSFVATRFELRGDQVLAFLPWQQTLDTVVSYTIISLLTFALKLLLIS